MGSPVKASVEAMSDLIAARLAADLAGFVNEYTGATLVSLWDTVDAIGDPDAENALAESAYTCDVQSLPENHAAALAHLVSRSGYRGFVSALSNLVRSTSGGSYATLRAYLVAVGAKVHPLFGNLTRSVLGESAFTLSSVVAGVSNPLYAAIFPSRVYVGADGALADDVSDAVSAATGDVPLFATNGHSVYIGADRPFSAVVIALSTLGSVTAAPTFQYWNGSTWATLTVVDNSAGLTRNDTITWTPPADWGKYYKDSGGTAFTAKNRLYYIRLTRTAAVLATPPVGTCITLIPTVIPTTVGGTAHLGIGQPPLALCRITGVNTMTVTLPANVDITRFAHPIGTEGRLRLRALTPIAADLTVTLAYVNDAAASASTAQSAWTAPAALGTKTLALTTTDGLRSVRTTSTVVTASTSGVFVVEAQAIRDVVV